jgi:hypothetical protein
MPEKESSHVSNQSLTGLTMEELAAAAAAVASVRQQKGGTPAAAAPVLSNSWTERDIREFTAGIGANFKRFLKTVAASAPSRVPGPEVHRAFRMADGSEMPEANARGAFGGFSQRVKKIGRAPWKEEWNADQGFMEYWMTEDVAALIKKVIA